MDDVVFLVISRAESCGRRGVSCISPGLIRMDDVVFLVISRADSYGRRGVSCYLQG